MTGLIQRHYAQTKELPFSAELLYLMVAHVDAYPEFLPWCLKAETFDHDTEKHCFSANLVAGKSVIRESFTSFVQLSPENYEIRIKSEGGLFKNMEAYWKIVSLSESSAIVTFKIDYAMNNNFVSKMIDPFFFKAQEQVLKAFEERAYTLYKKQSFE